MYELHEISIDMHDQSLNGASEAKTEEYHLPMPRIFSALLNGQRLGFSCRSAT
jgi:hypothetical protein